ncbi:MAG: hypothetical protein HC829_07595 [Bacteroidales bacterium]|nr:hypothetical protein [Bacteroidales bacterium]
MWLSIGSYFGWTMRPVRRRTVATRFGIRHSPSLLSQTAPAALTTVRRPYSFGLTLMLTIFAWRGRIKIEAFRRGQTVADMLRDLLARTFPDPDGGTP